MQKLPTLSFCVVFPALVFCFCNSQNAASGPHVKNMVATDSIPYDLQNPTLTMDLSSPDLKEISGLSPTETDGIYLAIGDERGEIFFLDANHGGSIVRRILFRPKGDFESIEMVGNEIWAAKSNGVLFEISDLQKDQIKLDSFSTPLNKSNDVEGLAYDKRRNALLMACKEDPTVFKPRNVFAFDLKTKQLGDKPVYSIDPEDVNQLVPYNDTDKHHAFSSSGIAIHPLTGDVYIISTALKRMIVLDYSTGKIKCAQRLDKKIMPQPEGISFDPKGNLYLSSEGKTGDGLLFKFNIKAKK